MPKRKERRDRRHSDSDIRAGPWTDSSGSASEDEAARGFIDDVTADLARVNPTNGIVMGLPWEAPLATSAKTKSRQKNGKNKEEKAHHHQQQKKNKKKKRGDKDRRRSASPQRAHKHGRHHDRGSADKIEANDNDHKSKKKERADEKARTQRNALREWTRHFEAEARDAEAVLGLIECSEWLRRYRAWLVEWRVASGDCSRALRRARPHEVDITFRGLRGAYAARAAGADALRALLSSTTPAQRRDPNWVRVHHFGGAYVASTDRLDAWIADIAPKAL
ncbi:hypothetical protein pmac_cds_119 [Pandoravirus macleodensis]|uniref:Uncharacterized protein n=1 Tax=Pandoravirus macleodensis TaxID=2107707 RepID=A0A2U7UEE4_9VIRU|nr:hypothetical protein pmac_cds_119 [Pandoravirus macleodensis]AVK76807.1 hypothetical protein pmac_cds_119 [Pandoravirus macleodensis]